MHTKHALLLIALAGILWCLWPQASKDLTTGDSEVLLDRIWLDRLPTSDSDKLHVLILASDPSSGIFAHTSAYEGDFAAFSWDAAGADRYRITLLQQKESYLVRMTVSAEDCGDFDYCMTAANAPRGARRYVSMKDWVLQGSSLVEPAVLQAHIQTALEQR